MQVKTVTIIAWACVALSLVLMVLGHFGSHELHWTSSQISTYAANAPYDYLISSAILFAALSLIVMSVLISRYQILGAHILIHFAPVLLGAAAAGLIMLASYEETANSIRMLKASSFWQIRIQSFHDAGLEIFFFSTLVFVMLAGFIVIFTRSHRKVKFIAAVIVGLAPSAVLLMATRWPQLLGFEGVTLGLNQRASLFCLWLAVALLLLISRRTD